MTWTAPRTWIAGETVTAAIMNAHIRDNLLELAVPETEASDTTDLLAQTNTTYAAGSPVVGVSITAPSSGKIKVITSGHLETNVAGNCYLSPEVRTGAGIGGGSVVYAANPDYGISAGGDSLTRDSDSRVKYFNGLTPGDPYNVRLMHQTTGGNYDIFYRELAVEMAR